MPASGNAVPASVRFQREINTAISVKAERYEKVIHNWAWRFATQTRNLTNRFEVDDLRQVGLFLLVRILQSERNRNLDTKDFEKFFVSSLKRELCRLVRDHTVPKRDIRVETVVSDEKILLRPGKFRDPLADLYAAETVKLAAKELDEEPLQLLMVLAHPPDDVLYENSNGKVVVRYSKVAAHLGWPQAKTMRQLAIVRAVVQRIRQRQQPDMSRVFVCLHMQVQKIVGFNEVKQRLNPAAQRVLSVLASGNEEYPLGQLSRYAYVPVPELGKALDDIRDALRRTYRAAHDQQLAEMRVAACRRIQRAEAVTWA